MPKRQHEGWRFLKGITDSLHACEGNTCFRESTYSAGGQIPPFSKRPVDYILAYKLIYARCTYFVLILYPGFILYPFRSTFLHQAYDARHKVLSSRKVLSGSGRAGRLHLEGKCTLTTTLLHDQSRKIPFKLIIFHIA